MVRNDPVDVPVAEGVVVQVPRCVELLEVVPTLARRELQRLQIVDHLQVVRRQLVLHVFYSGDSFEQLERLYWRSFSFAHEIGAHD